MAGIAHVGSLKTRTQNVCAKSLENKSRGNVIVDCMLKRNNRVEQHIIRRHHPMWQTIDKMCFNSKNLYNEANYVIRQRFIKENEYIGYYYMNKEFKTHDNYKACMSQPANCTLRLLDKNWKSYFKAIKDWKKNPSKYLGMPKLPKYLNKDGRYPWMIPNNSCYYDKEKGEICFRIRKLQGYHWKSRCLSRLIQVRFVPKGACYIMEVVYETETPIVNEGISRIASIDLGVNNLVTMTNNIGQRPIIINGRGVKSINQFYNKCLATEQSSLKRRNGKDWSKQLDAITFKRNQRIKNYMHNTSRYIVNWCANNNIDTLVVGHNNEWKQGSVLSKKTSQNFVMIPHNMLIRQLEYKCQDAGINFILTEEGYTSGTSFLDGELPVKENYDKSRRKHRGLFQATDTLINADVNGSLQIMRKVFPNAFDGCYGIEGVLTPVVINAVQMV